MAIYFYCSKVALIGPLDSAILGSGPYGMDSILHVHALHVQVPHENDSFFFSIPPQRHAEMLSPLTSDKSP